jgi:hypothetical protein
MIIMDIMKFGSLGMPRAIVGATPFLMFFGSKFYAMYIYIYIY